jgi:hypothetical protein
MTEPSRLSRPLQRRCISCRRPQTVALNVLYYVTVANTRGGTKRDGGFDCRFCGHQNLVPSRELPGGILTSLPSQGDRLLAIRNSPTHVANDPAPVPASIALAKTPSKTNPPRISTKPPVWVTGAAARQLLLTRHQQSNEATIFTRRTDGTLQVGALSPRGAGIDFVVWLDEIACELLVLGGQNSDGSRWKAVFHPSAGAAALAHELRYSLIQGE